MKITIVTKPLFIKNFLINTFIIYCYRISIKIFKLELIKFLKKEFAEFGGHYSVTRSLIAGFKNNKIQFNYNPIIFSRKIHNVVIVLSDARALMQMIKLKKNGHIKILIAGPNIVEFPFDCDDILCSELIDLVIVPSNWVSILYIKLRPILQDKIYVLPAGVDLNYWNVKKKTVKEKKVLIYLKGKYDNILYNECKKYLKHNNIEVFEIIYGEYEIDYYREKLSEVDLLIGFPCSSESQCIAWSECWATNTPTLIHSINTYVHRNIKYECSSAPYLNEINGLFFNNINDFINSLNKLLNKKIDNFNIREWVNLNMSDAIISDRILKKIREI